jgi:signal transduction histidine kinase
VTSSSNPISARLRARKQAISDTWETAVRRQIPSLRPLDSHALCDHLPEVLESLARWVEGDADAAKGFDALAEGHAVQRLGYGIDLETLTQEYSLLRSVLIRDCLEAAIEESSREAIARLNEGLDEAIVQAVRRYARGREEVRDRFIGILAHDLRNPLNTIAMASGRLLVGDNLDERITRAASMIVRSTDRMARMIDQVIHAAREHLGGGIPIALSAVDLGELCAEAVDELVAGNRDVGRSTRILGSRSRDPGDVEPDRQRVAARTRPGAGDRGRSGGSPERHHDGIECRASSDEGGDLHDVRSVPCDLRTPRRTGPRTVHRARDRSRTWSAHRHRRRARQ